MIQRAFTYSDGTEWAAEQAASVRRAEGLSTYLRIRPVRAGGWMFATTDRALADLTDDDLCALLAAALEREMREGEGDSAQG